MKDIKILGSGCAKCNKLYEQTESVATQMGEPFEIEKITDFNRYPEFGVMVTPALVVNGQLKSVGKVPSEDQIKEYLK